MGRTADGKVTLPEVTPEFWTQTEIRDDTGCWEWTGKTIVGGYGYWKNVGAHRVALASWIPYPQIGRPLAPDERPYYYALHRCDNPPCVNPEHLYWGTAYDNIIDRMERSPKCELPCKKTGVRCRNVTMQVIDGIRICTQHVRSYDPAAVKAWAESRQR